MTEFPSLSTTLSPSILRMPFDMAVAQAGIRRLAQDRSSMSTHLDPSGTWAEEHSGGVSFSIQNTPPMRLHTTKNYMANLSFNLG
jgi:hypothetical protein